MMDNFNEILTIIHQLEFGFDEVFITTKTQTISLDENFVKSLRANGKPTQEEMDRLKDDMLDSIKPEKHIEKKENQKIDPMAILTPRNWTLN